MTKPLIHWPYALRLGAAALIALPLLLLLSVGWQAQLFVHRVLYPGCQGERTSLDRFGVPSEAVTFRSRQGPELRGWFTRGDVHPQVVIVVLPGHAGNTCFTLADAAMIARAGYSTLIYEHRACADPDLAASTGPHEAQDLLGAVDYLASRPGVARTARWASRRAARPACWRRRRTRASKPWWRWAATPVWRTTYSSRA